MSIIIVTNGRSFFFLIARLIIQEMQIKITMRYHFAKDLPSIDKQRTSVDEDMENREHLLTVSGNINFSTYGKQF